MKRFLSFATAIAFSVSLANAQDPAVNNYPELSVIARVEGTSSSPYITPYIYTLLEGDLGSHFSYSVCNHWLSEDPAGLYKGLTYAGSLNWLDWAYFTGTFGNWSVSLGKDMLAMGGAEENAYDYDSYWEMSSLFWNTFQIYQWGGNVAYTTPSESNTFTFQVSSSPWNYRPFSEGLMAYSLKWEGDYDVWTPTWSAHTIGLGDKSRMNMFMLGNQFNVNDWISINADYMFRFDNTHFFAGENGELIPNLTGAKSTNTSHYLVASAKFDVLEQLSLTGKFGLETYKGGADMLGVESSYCFGGVVAEYTPARLPDLRVHALVSVSNNAFVTDNNFAVCAGVTYNINLSRFYKK